MLCPSLPIKVNQNRSCCDWVGGKSWQSPVNKEAFIVSPGLHGIPAFMAQRYLLGSVPAKLQAQIYVDLFYPPPCPIAALSLPLPAPSCLPHWHTLVNTALYRDKGRALSSVGCLNVPYNPLHHWNQARQQEKCGSLSSAFLLLPGLALSVRRRGR